MPFAINSFTSYAITLKKTFQKRLYFHTLEQSLMFFEGHLAYSIGPKHPPQGKFVLGLLLEPNLLVHTHLEKTLYSTEVILTFLLYF